MRPGRGSSLQRCTPCTACIRLHISRCTVVYDALQCIHIPRFFMLQNEKEVFYPWFCACSILPCLPPPSMVLSLTPLPPIALHLHLLHLNQPHHPCHLSHPCHPCHQCHPCQSCHTSSCNTQNPAIHSLPHPKLPLPHLPLLPPFNTFADPVASAIDHILKIDPVW